MPAQFLHLHWIGCLSWGLPPTRIHVVEQVWTEITQHAPEALADRRLEREPVVETDPALQAKFSLRSGETAAIAFALKHSGSLLLTDDAAARRACVSVGLAAVGTIGLILEAARSERVPIEEALQALQQLPNERRLHVTPELLARAIAALPTAT
jgi:predicted nucleic acid-binding protein